MSSLCSDYVNLEQFLIVIFFFFKRNLCAYQLSKFMSSYTVTFPAVLKLLLEITKMLYSLRVSQACFLRKS